MKIGNDIIINQYFYQGYGVNDAPTTYLWRTTLIDNMAKPTEVLVTINDEGEVEEEHF